MAIYKWLRFTTTGSGGDGARDGIYVRTYIFRHYYQLWKSEEQLGVSGGYSWLEEKRILRFFWRRGSPIFGSICNLRYLALPTASLVLRCVLFSFLHVLHYLDDQYIRVVVAAGGWNGNRIQRLESLASFSLDHFNPISGVQEIFFGPLLCIHISVFASRRVHGHFNEWLFEGHEVAWVPCASSICIDSVDSVVLLHNISRLWEFPIVHCPRWSDHEENKARLIYGLISDIPYWWYFFILA